MLIITFGDSLTVGYQSPTEQNPGGKVTPYGRYLIQFLGNFAEVKIRGINGELTEQMARRFERDVIGRSPDYVIILGGTNDLGYGVQPTEAFQNLVAMYERAIQAGIQPVAATVPSIRGYDRLIPPRQVLNKLIVSHCLARRQPYIDLFTATAEPGTQRLAESYSNDGLHLTTDGYRLLAELLYRNIFKNLVSKLHPRDLR